jgi:hypothetical protein
VLWSPRAESLLAATWVDGHDRPTIADVVDRLDRAFAQDPLAVGESRSDAYRMEVSGPLAFIFHVSEEDRKVTVVRVWQPFRES